MLPLRRALQRVAMSQRAMSTNAVMQNAPGFGSVTTEQVQEYYGKVLQSTKDLKTSACTTSGAPAPLIREALKIVPDEVLSKYYGCGSPLPTGIEGLSVLDLGSGSGRDCYVASNLVGENGRVIGVDMTDEQLITARSNIAAYTSALGYAKPNLDFKTGFIEDLEGAGVEKDSVDLCISNCVINLSPDKPAVLQGVHNVLKEGGELYFSDVYADRRLPEHVRKHEVLWGECVSGALYIEDFKRICASVGFTDPRVLESAPITITDPELREIVGEAKFYSITYRCFKLPQLETLCEDYGQVAYYKGTIPGHAHTYALDDHHVFEKGRPMLVCGNTASMVGESWLAKHFTIIGDRSTHFGLFDCGPSSVGSVAGGKGELSPGDALPGGCC